MSVPPEFELRYVVSGTVSHYVNTAERHLAAVCGVSVSTWDEWWGSGSQQEYDYVAALIVCRRCHRRIHG